VRNHKFHGGKKRKTRTLQKLTQAIRALETRTHKNWYPTQNSLRPPPRLGYKVTNYFAEVSTIATWSIQFLKNLGVHREHRPTTRTIVTSAYPKYLLHFTVVFVAYFMAGRLGQATTNIRSSNLGPVWPAYGVALAAVLFFGNRIWPAVTLAAFVVAALSPESYLTALGQAVGSTLAVVSGSFLLHRIAKFDNSISRLRDALALVLLGGLASAMVSATIGTLVLHAGNVRAYSGLASAWLIYWLGDSTGVLLVTPLLLTIPNLWRIRRWGQLAEFLCLLVILSVICTVVFGDLPLVPARMMAFAILPLIIWAAIRFGVSGTALSIFVVATVASVETALGSGSFARGTPFLNGVQLDAFFMVLSLTGLTFASLYTERERAERERAQSLREQVALEVHLQDEERLRASEERLRLAQKAARIGTFERDVRTGVVTCAGELESMYGLSPGDFDQTTADVFERLIHPDDRERLMSLSNQAMSTKQPTKAEWRVVWPDGTIHWIAGFWQVFADKLGNPTRIIGVNTDITERKLAEDRLREYERAVEGVEELIVVVDREHRCLMANREFLRRRNLASEQVVGRFVREFVAKDVYDGIVKPKLDECFQGKMVRFDLKYTYPMLGERDLLVTYSPIEGDHGVDRAACILHDITDRKRTEEALSDLSRKLIQAQEQERARIGRELHDDINQKLAFISLELEQLQGNPVELQKRVPELRKEIAELSNDVQTLSHDLHSSKLQYLGVVAGIRSWCNEFGERHGMVIDFRSEVSSALSSDLGLTLFRVVQEALHNAIKHSGVKRAEVQLLEENSMAIHLIVSDSGRGFDMTKAATGSGLGLTSMRERVRLVNGRISIDSKPMGGTRVHVHLPIEGGSQRAAV
jgi:PAS domain S-box-containing protein